ncbi:amidohydrolase [Maribacter sp. 2307ULW6-5]|uniref:amidohydrolase n=1 Tax=Maribacter sp. 2307ULW6-5 TaxID=3386275 RepID=UPI0039BD2EFE
MKYVVLFAVALLFGCKDKTTELTNATTADTIYHNGDIVTMEGDAPAYVEALAVKNGKIQQLGPNGDIMALKGPHTRVVNLEGKALFPGLIDAHAHFFGFGPQASGANLLPPPDAGVATIDDLVNTMKAWATAENIALTGWIFGLGFDDSQLEEQRFPTKADLDRVSTEHPVLALHISGHFCVMNSKALELVGIDRNTPDPEGGVIRRMPGSMEPNGVLEEMAAIPYLAKAVTASTPENLAKQVQAGLEMAKSYGYTTIREGKAMEQHEILAAFAEKHVFDIDVVSYVDHTRSGYLDSKWYSKGYTNRYRIGGIKMTLDGSPQGRTAWRTQPYLGLADFLSTGR